MTRAVGLDVGGTDCKVVVLDGDRELARDRIRIPSGDTLEFVVETARGLVERHSADSLGVGLAGLVTHPAGEFVWGPHVAGTMVPYRSVLSTELGFETAVDNDANLASFAEWTAGAGAGADPLVMVTLGTGIGVGIVIDGRIYRGGSYAGEAGHIEIVDGGEQCECGRYGCWETLVSGARFDRAAGRIASEQPAGAVARLAGRSAPSGEHLARAAAEGDLDSVRELAEAGRWLGRGLANLVLLMDPERIVIGGAAAAAGQPLLGPAAAVLATAISGWGFRRPVPLVPAAFGAFAGAVGAAYVGRQVQNGPGD